MNRTALTLAGLFAAMAAALFSCGRSPSLPTGPSTIVNMQVLAPSTIAPGSTAQLSARANYTDGSTKDVTTAVVWHSSDSSILTISATGLASGIHIGAVTITASSGNQTSAMQTIAVVPAGTFLLSGFVTGLGSSLDGAVVQVTAGTGAGLSSSTVNGAYQLLGVAGDIQVTVSKTAYVTATQAVTVNTNTSLNFSLQTVAPPPNLPGTYTLAITADPACMTTGAGALPSVARERQYTAVIKQMGNQVQAALSGANFAPGSYNLLSGGLTPDGATFDMNDPMYYYSGARALAELLPDGDVYLASGTMNLTLSGKDLAGTLNGTIRVAIASNLETIVGQCASTSHSVTFTSQSGSPARVRIRR